MSNLVKRITCFTVLIILSVSVIGCSKAEGSNTFQVEEPSVTFNPSTDTEGEESEGVEGVETEGEATVSQEEWDEGYSSKSDLLKSLKRSALQTVNRATDDSKSNSSVTVSEKSERVDLSEYDGLILDPNQYIRYTTLRIVEGMFLITDMKLVVNINSLISVINSDNLLSSEQKKKLANMAFNNESKKEVFSYTGTELNKSREDGIYIEPTDDSKVLLMHIEEEDVFFSTAWDLLEKMMDSYTAALGKINNADDVATNMYIIADNYSDFYKLMVEVRNYANTTVLTNTGLFRDFFNGWNSCRQDMAPPYFTGKYEFLDNLAELKDASYNRFKEISLRSRSTVWFSKEESENYLARYILNTYLDFVEGGYKHSQLSDKVINEFNKKLSLIDKKLATEVTSGILNLNMQAYNNSTVTKLTGNIREFIRICDVREETPTAHPVYLEKLNGAFLTEEKELVNLMKDSAIEILEYYSRSVIAVTEQVSRNRQAEEFYNVINYRSYLSKLRSSIYYTIVADSMSKVNLDSLSGLLDLLDAAYDLPYDTVFLKDSLAQSKHIQEELDKIVYEIKKSK